MEDAAPLLPLIIVVLLLGGVVVLLEAVMLLQEAVAVLLLVHSCSSRGSSSNWSSKAHIVASMKAAIGRAKASESVAAKACINVI